MRSELRAQSSERRPPAHPRACSEGLLPRRALAARHKGEWMGAETNQRRGQRPLWTPMTIRQMETSWS